MQTSPPQDPGVRRLEVDAIEEHLGAVQWRLTGTRRLDLERGATRTLSPDIPTLIYVTAGNIEICSAASRPLPRSVFTDGDVLLILGRQPVTVHVQRDARVVEARIRASQRAERLSVLPDVVDVRGFAEIEPTAAALAEHFGKPSTLPLTADVPLACHLMATTLVASVLRAWSAAGCPDASVHGALSDPYLAAVFAAVDADPAQEWTIDRLARMAALSRSAFVRRFRAATGMAPLQYVTEVRMSIAMTRLREHGSSVSATSRSLGYSSDEGFSRAFRRHTGVLPSQWRADHDARSGSLFALPGRDRAASVNSTVPMTANPAALASTA